MIPSIWNLEWLVYMSWSPKCIPSFFHGHCSQEESRQKDWPIRATPPAKNPLRQAVKWQAEQKPSKNMILNTHKELHLSCFHNCQRLLESRPSQHILPGNVWRGTLSELCIRSLSSVLAAENGWKYLGVRFSHGILSKSELLCQTLEWRRCQIILMRWKYKVTKVSLPN